MRRGSRHPTEESWSWRCVAAADLMESGTEAHTSRSRSEGRATPLAGTSRNPNGVLIQDSIVVPASAMDMNALRKESAFLK